MVKKEDTPGEDELAQADESSEEGEESETNGTETEGEELALLYVLVGEFG